MLVEPACGRQANPAISSGIMVNTQTLGLVPIIGLRACPEVECLLFCVVKFN